MLLKLTPGWRCCWFDITVDLFVDVWVFRAVVVVDALWTFRTFSTIDVWHFFLFLRLNVTNNLGVCQTCPCSRLRPWTQDLRGRVRILSIADQRIWNVLNRFFDSEMKMIVFYFVLILFYVIECLFFFHTHRHFMQFFGYFYAIESL